MFIDTHMHEMTYSPDSFLKLEEMVRIGKEKGLGALCITDHDSMGLKDYAAEYTANPGTGFYRSCKSTGRRLFCSASIPQ